MDTVAGDGAAVAAVGSDAVSLGAVVAEVEVEDGSGLNSIVGDGSEAKGGGWLRVAVLVMTVSTSLGLLVLSFSSVNDFFSVEDVVVVAVVPALFAGGSAVALFVGARIGATLVLLVMLDNLGFFTVAEVDSDFGVARFRFFLGFALLLFVAVAVVVVVGVLL